MKVPEARAISQRVAPELCGEDGNRWPDMHGWGVSSNPETGEPVVVCSFEPGREPADFPTEILGVKVEIRSCFRPVG